jgi:hypothetical protein
LKNDGKDALIKSILSFLNIETASTVPDKIFHAINSNDHDNCSVCEGIRGVGAAAKPPHQPPHSSAARLPE